MAANCAAQRAAEAQPTSSALSPARAEDCGAHSNVSCGPPRREASARAALRAAKALPIRFRPQPAENEDGAGAEYFGPPHPGAAGRPLTRGLSYSLSAPNTVPSPAQNKAQSTAQISSPMLGPARRENRNRFSRPKNRHGPKLAPILRPVSASLRLRYRSAAFSRACAISIFGSPPK